MSAAWIAAFVAVSALSVLTALVVLGTLRRATAALEEVEALLRAPAADRGPGGLAPGTPLPEFLAHRRGGGAFTAADLRGDNAVLVFRGADCPPCRALADDLRAARPPYLPSTLVLVVDEGREATAVIEGIDTEVIYQHGREVSQAFNSSATPHAFVIDRGGTVVATGTPNTLSALRELVVSLKREEVSRRSQEHSVVSA